MRHEGTPRNQAAGPPAPRPEGAAEPAKKPAIDYQRDAARWAEAGRPDRAAKLYSIALELRPNNWVVRLQLATCLADSHQPVAAARHFMEIARRYVAKQFPVDALEILHRILKLDPEGFSHANMSDMLLAIGPQAAPLCRRAVGLHREAGRDDHAADLLLLCSQLEPGNAEHWRELAQLYFDHQMKAEAAWALRQAGLLLLEDHAHRQYVDFAHTILWLEPHDLKTRRELSRVLVELGKPEQAVVELAALLRVNLEDEGGREILAHAFAASERPAASLSVLELLTKEMLASKRLPEAKALLQRARSWRPDDREFAQHLARLPSRLRAKPVPEAHDTRPTTDNGTLVLNLVDLARQTSNSRPEPQQESVIVHAASVRPEPRRDSVVVDATDLVEFIEHEVSQRLELANPVPPPPSVRRPQSAPRPPSVRQRSFVPRPPSVRRPAFARLAAN